MYIRRSLSFALTPLQWRTQVTSIREFTTAQAGHNKANRSYFDSDPLTLTSRKQARAKIDRAMVSGAFDWQAFGTKLLTTNPKLEKINAANKVLTTGLQLAPSFASGYNTCPAASGCAKQCLNDTGQGQRHMVQTTANGERIHYPHVARIARTLVWFEHREAFKAQLIKELHAHVRAAHRKNATPAVRLNVLSDIPWEKTFPELWALFPDVIFYDYTKNPFRVSTEAYRLTFSRNEINEELMREAVQGANLAVVFDTKKGKKLPASWHGLPVIDGDTHDNRFADPLGVVVGLRAKGPAKHDASGFVVPTGRM